jgi:hypothetical protein
MKFNYVKAYFSQLSNLGFQLLMLPLILFIIYYSQSVINLPDLRLFNEQNSRIIFYIVGGLCVTLLTAVQMIANGKANVIAREVGLGIKLEKLEKVLSRKMKEISCAVVLMPVMLLITGDSYFSIAFVVVIAWYFIQWPTPSLVCRLLKLRGDEREMIITRGEAFK